MVIKIFSGGKNTYKTKPQDIDVNVLTTTSSDQIYALLQKVKINTVGGVMELPLMEDYKKTEILTRGDRF